MSNIILYDAMNLSLFITIFFSKCDLWCTVLEVQKVIDDLLFTFTEYGAKFISNLYYFVLVR